MKFSSIQLISQSCLFNVLLSSRGLQDPPYSFVYCDCPSNRSFLTKAGPFESSSKLEPAEALRQRSSPVSKFPCSKGKQHAEIRPHMVTLFQIHSCLESPLYETVLLLLLLAFFGPLQVQYRKRRALASSTTQAKPSLRFSPVMALHRRMFHLCVRISSSLRA